MIFLVQEKFLTVLELQEVPTLGSNELCSHVPFAASQKIKEKRKKNKTPESPAHIDKD